MESAASGVASGLGGPARRGPVTGEDGLLGSLVRALAESAAPAAEHNPARCFLDCFVSWLVRPDESGLATISSTLAPHLPHEQLVVVLGEGEGGRVIQTGNPAPAANGGSAFPLEAPDGHTIGAVRIRRSRPLEEPERATARLVANALATATLERERFLRRSSRSAAPRPCDVLGRRERQVADLVGLGLTNGEIATRMGISPFTVANHLRHVYRKLNVSNRAEMVRLLVSG